MESSVVAVEDRSSEIKQKMHFTGTVKKIMLAGAIVDLGLDKLGLVHISQLVNPSADQPIKRAEDVLQVGQSVEVWVRKVKEDHYELTMIKPLDLEWREIKSGMVVKGTVVRLEKFGAFVEIGAERPGLIHISEMAHGYVRTPSEVVNEGDEVEAQVLEVNRRKKQIKLSLKALQEVPVKEVPVNDFVEQQPSAPREKPVNKRKRRTRSEENPGDFSELALSSSSEPQGEADPTFMEIALREAMEKAKVRKNQQKEKRSKFGSREQEDILSRTLENKVRTS
ncbi:MAG TPA: S1 RNA-binding domain-containing protein [Anaerolineaceae bacterium]|jgi:small subunit ribosomal protein S1